MDFIILILQILTFVALIIASFFVKNLLPSYFSEKGKNIATKEDIEELTEKVENVKIKFSEKSEQLKSDINLLYNLNLNHLNDEKNALLDFHLKFCKWINLLTLPIELRDDDDLNEIIDYTHKITLFEQVFLDSLIILEIYNRNENLANSVYNIRSECYKKFIPQLKTTLIKLQSIVREKKLIENEFISHTKSNEILQLIKEKEYLIIGYSNFITDNKEFMHLKVSYYYHMREELNKFRERC